ncbi:MAG: ribonuclease III [Simkaniaceae bacterium]
MEELKNHFSDIERAISYAFKNKQLLITAFTHRSFMNENREIVSEHNERLEFLGDAVLTLIISDFLFHHLPLTREGDLSHLRAQLVDAAACAAFIQKLNVHSYILLGKGELLAGGKGRESIFSDLFEAILGAIYLDGGMEASRKFVLEHFMQDILHTIEKPSKNWKAELQDYAQKNYQQIPLYRVMKEEGPDHQKIFYVSVILNEKELGKGTGTSKKKAEQEAAKDALEKNLGIADGES